MCCCQRRPSGREPADPGAVCDARAGRSLTRIKPGPEGPAIIVRSPRTLSMATIPLTLDSPVATPSGAEGEAAIADDPELQAGFTSWERAGDGRRVARSHLLLAGLWCAGCAGAIERALRAEPGVLEASASYASLRATVVWDPAAARVSGLLAAVRRAGYDAAPDAAASARALRQADERKALWRLFVAVFCMMQVMMYQAPLYVAAPGTLSADLRTLLLWAAWLLSIPVLLFSAAPMFRDAWEAMRQRRIGMDLPVSIGILITFVVSTGATFAPGGAFGAEPYFDSLTMFVAFLLAGRYLALKARHRVAASLEGALSRLPSAVRRLASDGTVELVGLHRLASGDRVRVLAGEAFPADGPLETAAEVDEALLTGESRPVAKQPGEEAIAGSFNLAGPVVQRVERLGADTRYAGIVSLMRTAMSARPPLLRAADRIAGPFLWGVLLLAAWAGAAWSMIDPSRAVWVMVSVLIVTCPCALSLAAPSALLAAAGALIRRGVLVQRFDALEGLAALDTICFDKTGTITEACPQMLLAELQSAGRDAGLDEAGARAIAALLATSSNHPLSAALAAQASAVPAPLTFNHVTEFPGFGVQAIGSDNRVYRLGAAAWATRGLAETRRDGRAGNLAGRSGRRDRALRLRRGAARRCAADDGAAAQRRPRAAAAFRRRRRARPRRRPAPRHRRSPRQCHPRRQARKHRRDAGRRAARRHGGRRPERRPGDGPRRRLLRHRRGAGADPLERRLRAPLRQAGRHRRSAPHLAAGDAHRPPEHGLGGGLQPHLRAAGPARPVSALGRRPGHGRQLAVRRPERVARRPSAAIAGPRDARSGRGVSEPIRGRPWTSCSC